MARFTENLNPCVRQVLCGLSKSVREALRALIAAQVAILQVQIAQLEAYSAYLDVLTLPVSAASSLAEQFIQQVKSAAQVIPLDLIGTCVDVGNLNRAIEDTLNTALQDVNVLTNDLNRLLSFSDEVGALIDDLNETLNLYNAILDIIDLCGAPA